MRFYMGQSDVQLSAQTLQQVIVIVIIIIIVFITMMTMMMTAIVLNFIQIASFMKAWCGTFGVEGIMQSLGGEGEDVRAAFNALLQ